MDVAIESPKSLGGRQFQLLSNQALVDTWASCGGAECELASSCPEYVVERVNRRIAARTLELGDGGLAHPESVGEGDLAEASVITRFADQHGGIRHISIIT